MNRTQKNKATEYHLGQLKVSAGARGCRRPSLRKRQAQRLQPNLVCPCPLPLQAKLAKLRTELQAPSSKASARPGRLAPLIPFQAPLPPGTSPCHPCRSRCCCPS